MTLRSLTLRALALLLAALPTPAQTGPFASDELLIQRWDGCCPPHILRVDPLTGDGEVLTHVKDFGGWAGGMAYDSYRDAVLACFSLDPDPYWKYQLYAVASDGSSIALPGLTSVTVRALAPAGDGRIYLQRSTTVSSQIEYFDAGNQLHVLMDETGTAPLLLPVEHLRYHAPSQALIGTLTNWTGPSCSANQNTLYRIPLSADGSQLSGPVTCVSFAQTQGYIMGLDDLPGDLMLMTLAAWNQPQKLWSVDAWTLAMGSWANVDSVDLNGGVYCPPLGAAIVFEDFQNELQVHAPGSAGSSYTLLPVDVPIGDGSTGSSPKEILADIGAVAAPCAGSHDTYGAGLAGLGGYVPKLDATGCPDLFNPFSIVVNGVRGGQTGILFGGLGSAAIPFKGGTFLLDQVHVILPITLPGSVHTGGEGHLALPVTMVEPGLVGVNLYVQGLFTDAAAVKGVSMTNGLHLIGY